VAEDVRFARGLEKRRSGPEPDRLAAIVLAEVDRLTDVRVGLPLRLAGLEDLECGEGHAAPTHDRRGAGEDGSAVLPARGLPGGPGIGCDRDGALRLGGAGPSGTADDGRDVTRVDGDDALFGRYGPAVDQHRGREREGSRRAGDGGGEPRA